MDFPKVRLLIMRVSDVETLPDSWYYDNWYHDRPAISYEVVTHDQENKIVSFMPDNWNLRKLSLLELELL
jgi:hypothetical protein